MLSSDQPLNVSAEDFSATRTILDTLTMKTGLHVGVVASDIAVGAVGLGLDFRTGQMKHSYPLLMSNFSGLIFRFLLAFVAHKTRRF